MSVVIILPVYSTEKYIYRCLDSVLSQTYEDFKLVIVDDGSPDNCGSICDNYAKNDSRIHVIHKKNGGLSDARNAGIEYALQREDCEWITLIDSDDWVHPKYLESLYYAAVNNGLKLSVCGFERTENAPPKVNGDNIEVTIYDTEVFQCEKVTNATVAWGKLYKKEFFRDIRYPIGLLHEDEFTTYKILFQNEKIAYVPEPLYAYYLNPSSIMLNTWSEKHLVAEQAYLEQIDFFKTNGYHKAFEKTLQHYCQFIVRLMQNDEVPVTIKETYSQKLRSFMGQYHQYFEFQRDKLFYEYAYPKRMALYWNAKKVIPFIR